MMLQLIGRTPLVYINKLTKGCGTYTAAKQQMMQPTSSVRQRSFSYGYRCRGKKSINSREDYSDRAHICYKYLLPFVWCLLPTNAGTQGYCNSKAKRIGF